MARLDRLRAFFIAESLLSKAWLFLAVLSLMLVTCSWLPSEYDTWWLAHAAALPVVWFGFSVFVFTSGNDRFLRFLSVTKRRLPAIYWACLFFSLAYLLWIVVVHASVGTGAQSPRPLSLTSRILPSVDLALSLSMFGLSHWASTRNIA
jgi:hypothetical protein